MSEPCHMSFSTCVDSNAGFVKLEWLVVVKVRESEITARNLHPRLDTMTNTYIVLCCRVLQCVAVC